MVNMKNLNLIVLTFLVGHQYPLFAANISGDLFESGKMSVAEIQAALTRESQPPSAEVEIRASGDSSQYLMLDDIRFIGKKIRVKFYEDQYAAPGEHVTPYSVDQMVVTKDYLDVVSRQAVETLKQESLPYSQSFQEVGVWILHTATGSYKSDTFTSHETHAIANKLVTDALDQVIARAQQSEGSTVKAEDIEFYHSHLERGEAFSPGDADFQDRYVYLVKKYLVPGGTYSAHAVPVQGQVLFRRALK